MGDGRRDISIKRIIIIIFILSMVVSISSIGYLMFTNWLSSARKTTESIAVHINEDIYNQVNSFMCVPEHINEINHKIIENGYIDFSDDMMRDKYFVGVLSSHNNNIYSFSYGMENGE